MAQKATEDVTLCSELRTQGILAGEGGRREVEGGRREVEGGRCSNSLRIAEPAITGGQLAKKLLWPSLY